MSKDLDKFLDGIGAPHGDGGHDYIKKMVDGQEVEVCKHCGHIKGEESEDEDFSPHCDVNGHNYQVHENTDNIFLYCTKCGRTKGI
jgi:hypothetical protein